MKKNSLIFYIADIKIYYIYIKNNIFNKNFI